MTARKKAEKKRTRTPRAAGELPSTMTGERVERTLEDLGVPKAKFLKAYEATAKPRGGGRKPPPAKLARAYATFKKTGDIHEFCETMGLDSQRANAAIGRMVVWEAQEGGSPRR